MHTPNLDTLILDTQYESRNILLSHRTDMRQRQFDRLVASYGPSLVDVLKWYVEDRKGCACFKARQYICRACRARTLLTRMEQEAT
jgi:hypothetical protein